MASAIIAAAIIANLLLLLHPWTATSDILAPILGTMDFSCTEPAPSVHDKETRANTSVFDPCHWSDCGGGTCNKTSPVTYTCECKEGYYNLLKIGAFPCFQDCALGMDCAGLGISIMNNSSPTPPSMTDSSTNQASSLPHGNINWLITVTMILAILKSN
ncbi:hypothetical protein RHSIM_Rhsim04G0198400 [Rhododendron simsii]|uniref:EGF-like domain-containing protein n=1 Tax=Rhododendron simsii TaxID=118357 RepID=A0A834H3M5_RHOSS|nr:hypothetical protein RHSIM_Rhsim04G0198400 [Rhododendron simsii]